jgi:hypothetical protein
MIGRGGQKTNTKPVDSFYTQKLNELFKCLKHSSFILLGIKLEPWRMNMTEQQSDDLYIPEFFLTLPPKAGTDGHGSDNIEEFLSNVQGWTEVIPPDEDDEWI